MKINDLRHLFCQSFEDRSKTVRRESEGVCLVNKQKSQNSAYVGRQNFFPFFLAQFNFFL